MALRELRIERLEVSGSGISEATVHAALALLPGTLQAVLAGQRLPPSDGTAGFVAQAIAREVALALRRRLPHGGG